ncbi:PP2C family protein-serine/threonine phosphatase [Streptomyces sp. NPDC002888]|uniref:PP2C family protein-serine/threonine phosphatase n=1 Tax=Streptomyces sp. NPDC002888 TaxID=3364668 RepID=UPI003693CCF9
MIRIKAGVPRGVRPFVFGLPIMWGALAITYRLVCPLAQQHDLGTRIVTTAVFFAAGAGLILQVRRALLQELKQARRVARAAQNALLRPLPSRVGGLHTAVAQLSADHGARVGGDLYEVIATEHGVRVVMGDVRGHGLAALGTVAAVLGSFREAVHDEPELGSVLRRLDRALARHLAERARDDHAVAEEFVTVLLLEIRPDGELLCLNCGHPWPYRLAGTRVEALAATDPLPPLGPFPLPRELPAQSVGHLLTGESLILHTDGAEDARDGHGRFFSLPDAIAGAVRGQPVTPQTILRTVFDALLRHTAGRPTDDIALLVLRNERSTVQCGAPPGARDSDTCGSAARARPAPTYPHPTNHL